MPTSMNSRSASTDANRAAVASSSTACWSRPLPSSRFPINLWSNVRQCRPSKTTRCSGHLSQINTHLPAFQLTACIRTFRMQPLRRLLQQIYFLFECGCGSLDLLIGLVPPLLLNGFSHARHGFHAIARVETRRVKHVLEPRAIGQSLIIRQNALGTQKIVVEFG